MARASRGDTNKKANSPFATRLSQLMNENPVTTQAELAKITDKTRQTVSQYVNGISEPGYDTLVKIADHFNVSLDYLLGRSNTKTLDTSIQAACEVTGLSEQSVIALHQQQGHGNMFPSYTGDYLYGFGYSFLLIDEFIEFVFSDTKTYFSPLSNYFYFIDYYEKFQKKHDEFLNMSPEEKRTAERNMRSSIANASRSGIHPLSLREASKFFRSAFCDSYEDFLKAKYPLDKPSADTKED